MTEIQLFREQKNIKGKVSVVDKVNVIFRMMYKTSPI